MRSKALIVGINQHPPEAELDELHGAVADAVDFAEWILQPDGGGVAPEDLFFWTMPRPADHEVGPLLKAYLASSAPWPKPPNGNRLEPPDMTRSPKSGEIKQLVNALSDQATVDMLNGQSCRIFVHFAGHGILIEDETCFLVGDYAEGSGLVPCNQLAAAMRSKGVAQVLLFVDCCRNRIGVSAPVPALFTVGRAGNDPLAIGLATKKEQYSFEEPDAPPKRGAFTRALTNGLRTKRDPNGTLTFDALGKHVHDEVKGVAAARGRVQEPQFSQDPPNPPITILAAPATPPVRDIVVTFKDVPLGAAFQLMGGPRKEVLDFVADRQGQRIPALINGVYVLNCANPSKTTQVKHDGPGESSVEF